MFSFSQNRIEKEKAKRQKACEQYREELSEVEKMLETSKNDLFTLRTDAIQQKEEKEKQLKGDINSIEQNISECYFLI